MDDASLDGPILPPHIEETIRAIAELRHQQQRRANAIQRVVERSVGFIARPRFVALLAAWSGGWIAINASLAVHGV